MGAPEIAVASVVLSGGTVKLKAGLEPPETPLKLSVVGAIVFEKSRFPNRAAEPTAPIAEGMLPKRDPPPVLAA